MTPYKKIYAGAQTQIVLLGFRNLLAKNLAFSLMCEILLLFSTISLHYYYVQIHIKFDHNDGP